MNREVDLPVPEGAHDLGDEQALAAGRRGVGGGPAVSGGDHRNELGLGAEDHETLSNLLGLGEGERRPAGADAKLHARSGSIPKSSAAILAYASSLPGVDSSFRRTIGSCRSLAATPRASASTARRWSGSNPASPERNRSSSARTTASPRSPSARIKGARCSERRRRTNRWSSSITIC